jgi:hypothetical protein
VTIRLSDLSPRVRHQLVPEQGKPKRAKGGGSVAFKGHCHYCKTPIPSGAAMDRHRIETGHARFEIFPPLAPRSIP